MGNKETELGSVKSQGKAKQILQEESTIDAEGGWAGGNFWNLGESEGQLPGRDEGSRGRQRRGRAAGSCNVCRNRNAVSAKDLKHFSILFVRRTGIPSEGNTMPRQAAGPVPLPTPQPAFSGPVQVGLSKTRV